MGMIVACSTYETTGRVNCKIQYNRVVNFKILYSYCGHSCTGPERSGGTLGDKWTNSEIRNTRSMSNLVSLGVPIVTL